MGLASDNADHVAISPAGVFVFETKWSGTGWSTSRQASYLEHSARQARERAESFRRRLLAFGLKGEQARPVLVLWGLNPTEHERVRNIGRVVAVAGPWLTQWAEAQPGGVLDKERIGTASGMLREHLLQREPHVLAESPRGRFVRLGLSGMLDRLTAGMASFSVALPVVLFGAAYGGRESWEIGIAGAAMIAAAAGLAWWRKRGAILFGATAGAIVATVVIVSVWLAVLLS